MDPAVETGLRAALALMFLAAGAQKARDPRGFRAVLAAYRLVPVAAVPLAASALPAAELATGVALLLPATRVAGLLAAAALLALYAGAIGANLLRGRREIDCGCAGPGAHTPLSGWLVARNALAIVAALGCLAPVRARPLAWVDAVTVAGLVAVLAALQASFHRLLANAPGLARIRA